MPDVLPLNWDNVILKHLEGILKKDLFGFIQKEGSYQFTYVN